MKKQFSLRGLLFGLVTASLAFTFTVANLAPTIVHAESSQAEKKAEAKKKVKKEKTTYKNVTRTESIKFTSTTQDDATLAKGQTKLL